MTPPTLLDKATIKIPDLDGDGIQESMEVKKYRYTCQKGDDLGYCFVSEGKRVKPGTVVEYWEERGNDRGEKVRGYSNSYGVQLQLSTGKKLSDLELNMANQGVVIMGVWNDSRAPKWSTDYFTRMLPRGWWAQTTTEGQVQAGYNTQNLVQTTVSHGGQQRDYMMVHGLNLVAHSHTLPTFKKGYRVSTDLGSAVITGFQIGMGILDTETTSIPALSWLNIYVMIEYDDGKIGSINLRDARY